MTWKQRPNENLEHPMPSAAVGSRFLVLARVEGNPKEATGYGELRLVPGHPMPSPA